MGEQHRLHEMTFAEIGKLVTSIETERDAWRDAIIALSIEHRIPHSVLIAFLNSRDIQLETNHA